MPFLLVVRSLLHAAAPHFCAHACRAARWRRARVLRAWQRLSLGLCCAARRCRVLDVRSVAPFESGRDRDDVRSERPPDAPAGFLGRDYLHNSTSKSFPGDFRVFFYFLTLFIFMTFIHVLVLVLLIK